MFLRNRKPNDVSRTFSWNISKHAFVSLLNNLQVTKALFNTLLQLITCKYKLQT